MLWIALALTVVFAGLVVLWTANSRIARAMPSTGTAAPPFSLPDQTGAERSLDEFRGRWLVLYFYPRDDTPGCTEQAMRFRNGMRELEAAGGTVCGVSVDAAESHAAFARKYNLPFPLLSDRDGHVAARYGSLRNFGLIRFARRNTFLIDPEGRIAKTYLGVNAGRNAAEVTEELKTMRLSYSSRAVTTKGNHPT